MVDKSRSPRRPGGGDKPPARFAPKAGRPGERPAAKGRGAGKPATGPARSRTVAGVDRFLMEKLEAEGMLTAEGRRALESDRGAGGRGPRGGKAPTTARGADVARGGGDERPRKPLAARAKAATAPARPAGVKPGTPEAEVAERLHKVMAQAGVASRRHSEELIQAGRVTVNGRVVTELGLKVVPGRDIVEVDGRPLGKPESVVYLLLNKPKGYVTTLFDPQGRAKVTDLLGEDVAQRVYPVGRLDWDTEGLLLLTNDGELANALMHPAKQVKKTYIAKVRGVPGPAKLKALESGIELDDGPTAPAEVKLIEARGPNAATVSIRIHEGRNRQVRRMFEAVGHEVIHLKRSTLGPLHLGDLPVGAWRELTGREVDELKRAAGVAAPVSRGAKVAAIVEQRKARRGAARFTAPREEYREEGPRPRPARGPSPKGPSPFAEERPARPAFRGGDRPAPRGERPAFQGDRPAFRGGDRPAPRGERPAFRGGDRPQAGGGRDRAGFGGGRPVKAGGPKKRPTK